MVFTKKVTKSPSVMVETKKMSAKDTCGTGWCCHKMKHLLVPVLLILNTILLTWVVCNQVKIESGRVWGSANYRMLQKIQSLPAFKEQYKQQLEQGLQMYQGGWAVQQPAVQPTAEQAPTTTETAPVVTQ